MASFENRPIGQPSKTTEERIRQQVLQVCNAVGDFIETWGFRGIHGKTWALLALSNQPLSQSQIAQRLGVSRSLVNLAISELAQRALVEPVDETRNSPYRARTDVWPSITNVLRSREWTLIEQTRLALEPLRDELLILKQTGKESTYDINRVELLLTMTELAQTMLRAILAVRMPASTEALLPWMRGTRRVINGLQKRIPILFPSKE